jgi:soluble lytic murein transglycosylase-like protein
MRAAKPEGGFGALTEAVAYWTAVAGCLLAAVAAAAQSPARDGVREATSDLVAQATAYEHGEGVPKDQLKAAALYCEAAREGDPEAQYSLGWMYANGRGVPRDDAVAASFFALAAATGHAGAQKALRFVGDDRGRLPGCMHRPDPSLSQDAIAANGVVDPFADLPDWKKKIADEVAKLAPRFAVDTRLALAVIAVESNFDPRARSPKDAMGLMQLIPETAARFNVKDPFDVGENVKGGLAYLRWLLSYYKGYIVLAAAAYNAGEAAVDRYQGIPPYLETRDYVRQVLRLYGNTRHPYDPRIVKPASFLPASDKPL